MKILMVCLGNICRSPLAEGIFRQRLDEMQLEWEVDSAGTSGFHAGEQPDPRSIQVAEHHGLDIRNQASRPVRRDDFHAFDYIFAMDGANLQNLMEMNPAGNTNSRIHRFLEFAGDHTLDVPDPYYDDQGFAKVFQLLDKASDRVIQRIIEETGGMTEGVKTHMMSL